MRLTRNFVALAAIVMSVMGTVATASPANADVWVDTDTQTSCDSSCVVFYFNSSYGGSRTTVNGSANYDGISNLAPYTFLSSGSGQGQALKNNAASAKARNPCLGCNATIYFNSGYGGACDQFEATYSEYQSASQLTATYNNNASVLFRSKMVYENCHIFKG